MIRPLRTAVIVATVALLATPVGAPAHKADPNYLSTITGVEGLPDGADTSILNRGDEMALVNRSGKTLTVLGYKDEPYARVAADGTVSVNLDSEAYFLNQERDGIVDVPDGVDSKGAPRWQVVDRSGRFSWHDHRIHWMADTRPEQVTDPDVRTKIYDWDVTVAVDGSRTPATIMGLLEWTPTEDGGAPTAAVAGFVVLLVASGVLVVVVRRRRDEDGDTDDTAEEAW